MSTHIAQPGHEVVYQDLIALVNRHAAKVSAIEVLAIAANMLGKIVAMQDQRTVTPEMAMEVVSRNLEVGNQQVLAQLESTAGMRPS